MKSTRIYQVNSALNRLQDAGMRFEEKADMTVIVGVTSAAPMNDIGLNGVIHFCSSTMQVQRYLRKSFKKRVMHCTVHADWRPEILMPAIVRFTATVESEGYVHFRRIREIETVQIPYHLHQREPWSYSGGSEFVASEMGCRNLNEMFAKFGQPIS